MATVFIPSLMQNLSEGADRVTVEGNTVRKIIDNLEEIHILRVDVKKSVWVKRIVCPASA